MWARIAQAGTRVHPAYAEGMPRLSCSFCVLASRGALVRAAQLRPELAEVYRQQEERRGFTFKADLSMADIIAAAKVENPAAEPGGCDGWAA